MSGPSHGGVATAGRLHVEAAVPLATLAAVGLPSLDAEEGLVAGIFRAEFSHGDDGETIESWMSWIDPKSPRPIFTSPPRSGVCGCGSSS